MAIVSIKCPSCGAKPQLDDSKERGFCSYCGSPVQIQDAVAKLKVELSGNVKVDGLTEIEKLKDAGNSLQAAGKLQEAQGYWSQVIKIDPTDGDARVAASLIAARLLQNQYASSSNDSKAGWAIDKNVENIINSENYVMAKKYALSKKFDQLETELKTIAAKMKAEQETIAAKMKAEHEKIIAERAKSSRAASGCITSVIGAVVMIIFLWIISTYSGSPIDAPFALYVVVFIALIIVIVGIILTTTSK